MKRICFAIIFSILLCGCSGEKRNPVNTEPTSGNPVDHVATENWNRYEITDANPLFSSIINKNPIDAAYNQEKSSLSRTLEYIELEKKYLALWQEEMTYSVEKLLAVLTEQDAHQFQNSQNAWCAAVDADLESINAILQGEQYSLPNGSNFSWLLLSEKREIYRERTIKIKYIHYLIESKAVAQEEALQSVLFREQENA